MLFLGRCTRAFTTDDPRIDLRPWARAATGPLEPINMISPDVDGFILPAMMRARQLEEAGAGPWWDRCQLLGLPLAANIPFPFLYPASWLFHWATPMTTIDGMLWLHVSLALLLAYRCCRLMGVAPAAAAAGAIGCALSAVMFVRWRGAHEVYAIAWWPAQLAAIERLRAGRRRRALLETVIATSMMMLAGFPQTAMVLTLGTLLAALLDRELHRARALATLGLAIALGVSIAWPQLEISARAFVLSIRASDATRAATARRGMPPAALIAGVLPDFFGHPSQFSEEPPPARTMEAWLPHRRWLGSDIQQGVYYNAFYPGMLLVLLVPVLAWESRARRLALIALIALLACVTSPLVAPHLPWAQALATGNVKRLLVLVDACWPIAGALALQGLWQPARRPPRRIGFALVLALLAAFALLPWWAGRIDDPEAPRFAALLVPQVMRQGAFLVASAIAVALSLPAATARRADRAWMRWLPAVVLAADLGAMTRAYNPMPIERADQYPRTPAITQLAARPGRVVPFGVGPNLVPAPLAGLFGIRSMLGNAPMVPRRTAELLACLEGPLFDLRDPRVGQPLTHVESLSHPLLDLLGVDTVVHADLGLAAKSGLPTLFESWDERIGALARPSAGPPAFLCGGMRLVRDSDERLATIADRRFAPHRTVLLEEPLPFALPESGAMQPLVDHAPVDTRHELTVDAAFDGLVVLTEAWDPGWEASVDGHPEPVRIADHALMAVAVRQGHHRIELSYVPPGLRHALAIAAMAIAAAIALLAFHPQVRAKAGASH